MFDWFTNLTNGLSSTVVAILLLCLAWLAATIARNLVKKLLGSLFATRLANVPEAITGQKDTTVELLGNIVYAIVFLLFLPGALEKLGLSSVTAPLTNMASKFMNYLPNIIAAGLVLVFGFFLAKLVKQVLTIGLQKTPIDKLQERAGIQSTSGTGFSDILANLAYAAVLVVFVIAGLQVLQLDAISRPATEMVNQVFSYVPQLFAAIVLVSFGVFLANLVSNLLTSVLKGTGIDKTAESLFPTKSNGTPTITASWLISTIVKVVINVFFVVSAVNILQIDVLTQIGTEIIHYLPNVLASLIILVLAWILGNQAEKAIVKANPNGAGMALGAKAAIFVLACIMALTQLGIAPGVVNRLFTILLIGVAAAFAVAFGIGGADWAKKKLAKMDETVEKQLKK
ncbi:MAG: mechanosensitive ion channel [Solobacterium sp.]|nr:mechanosensitive ion channel [Solobacterium sp.]